MTPNKSDESMNKALYAAREEIIREMPTIITEIIKKAKEGSYLHAKFLLEFAIGDAATAPAAPGGEQSLAAMLLKELRDEPTQ